VAVLHHHGMVMCCKWMTDYVSTMYRLCGWRCETHS